MRSRIGRQRRHSNKTTQNKTPPTRNKARQGHPATCSSTKKTKLRQQQKFQAELQGAHASAVVGDPRASEPEPSAAGGRRLESGTALTVLHEHVAVRAPMPGRLLLPCAFDEVQGRQTRPPLVPQNLSRLLPHKVRLGTPFQERVQGLPERSVSSEGRGPTDPRGFTLTACPRAGNRGRAPPDTFQHRRKQFFGRRCKPRCDYFRSVSVGSNVIARPPKGFLI